jgi:hypothetical protein
MGVLEDGVASVHTRKWRVIAKQIRGRHPALADHIEAEVNFWVNLSGQDFYMSFGRRNWDRFNHSRGGSGSFDYSLWQAAIPLVRQLDEALDDEGQWIRGKSVSGFGASDTREVKQFKKRFAAAERAGQMRLDFNGAPAPRRYGRSLLDSLRAAEGNYTVITGTVDWGSVTIDADDPFAD